MTRTGDLQAGPGAVWHPGPVDGSGMVAQAWSAGLSQGASIRAEKSCAMSDPKTLTPEQRIKELEQQLELMSQKAQFFETVVDVLKNDYGVSVVKKRSGKSSRKVKSQD